MLSRHRSGSSFYEVVSYTLPKLHSVGKNWYVDFYCFDPITDSLRRKKYMLDGIDRPSDRKKRAMELIASLAGKLRSGWNPWAEAGNERQYASFENVLNQFQLYISKMEKTGAMKQKTVYDYLSRLSTLIAYNGQRYSKIVYIYQFDLAFISDFLDYILLDRDSSARTRNNYRTWLSALCSWLVEKKYLLENPVSKIRCLPEEQKFRSALTADDLHLLREHLGRTNKPFLLACMMEYYTFIRPTELTYIKVGDIRIKEQKIFISSAFSKNRRDGMVGINDELIRLMIELDVFSHPNSDYLFGEKFIPSQDQASARIFRDSFVNLRKTLKWPAYYQFYSLKDSGIRDLANAEGIVVARDQARHADITTTNKYLKGDALTVHDETKHFKGNL